MFISALPEIHIRKCCCWKLWDFFWTYTHITSREKLENKGRGRTEIVNVVSGVYVLRRISFFSWKVESSRTEVLFIQHLKFFSLFFRYYYLPTCQTLFFRLLKGAKSSLLFTHWFKFLFDKKRFVKRKSNVTTSRRGTIIIFHTEIFDDK